MILLVMRGVFALKGLLDSYIVPSVSFYLPTPTDPVQPVSLLDEQAGSISEVGSRFELRASGVERCD